MNIYNHDSSLTDKGEEMWKRTHWKLVDILEALLKEGADLRGGLLLLHDTASAASQTVLNRVANADVRKPR